MNPKRLFFSVPGVLLVSSLALAGCSDRVTGQDAVTQVYSMSADGRALIGHVRGEGGAETGRVTVPAGSVWSMAGTGEADLVWVHAPEQTLLVDTRRWTVLTRWSRVGDPSLPVVAKNSAE